MRPYAHDHGPGSFHLPNAVQRLEHQLCGHEPEEVLAGHLGRPRQPKVSSARGVNEREIQGPPDRLQAEDRGLGA